MQNRRFLLLLLLLLNGFFPGKISAQGKVDNHHPGSAQQANKSVPLPAFKPSADQFQERGVKTGAMEMPSPSPLAEARPAMANAGNGPQNNNRILTLPASYRGYAIELIRSKEKLLANAPGFLQHPEIFCLPEKDGKCSYLIANLGTRETATAYFKQKIMPFNKLAQLVVFTKNGKLYLNP